MAANGDHRPYSGNRPAHRGQFQALSNDAPTAGLHHAAPDEQIHFPEERIAHPFHVLLEVTRGLVDLVGEVAGSGKQGREDR